MSKEPGHAAASSGSWRRPRASTRTLVAGLRRLGALLGLTLLAPAGLVGGCFPLEPPAEVIADATGDPPGVHARQQIPSAERGLGFWETPWPQDFRRLPDGRPDVRGFPNPTGSPTIFGFVVVTANLIQGFGTSPAITFVFDGPLDLSTLPGNPQQTLLPDSAVSLIDLGEAASPDRPAPRLPLSLQYLRDGDRFRPPFTLTLRPVFGIQLQEGRTYAALITRRLADGRGQPVAPTRLAQLLLADDERLRELTRTDLGESALPPDIQAARELYRPLRQVLEAEGLDPELPVAATLFTTGRPSQGAFDAWTRVQALPAPTPRACAVADEELGSLNVGQDAFTLVRCTVELPQFQSGTPPYEGLGSGEVLTDVQRRESVVFHLCLPRTPAPADGFPVVLYAHGTGGDSLSAVLSGVPASGGDGLAASLARAGLATVALELGLHGSRNPRGPEANPANYVYNWRNPVASRDNVLQAAIDLMSAVRLIGTLAAQPALLPGEGAAARLDPERLVFLGHSQGAQGGALLLATEPALRGGALTGAGGGFAISLFQKKKPVDLATRITDALRFAPGDLDLFHPLVDLIQSVAEPADPLVYGPSFFLEPRSGKPRSVLIIEGGRDEHSPPATTDALAAAAGIPLVGAEAEQIPVLELAGLPVVRSLPVAGNVAGGQATAGLLRYPAGDHFVATSDPEARRRLVEFLASLADDGIGRIGP